MIPEQKHTPMKCEKMMYLMVLYLNGELNDIDKHALESHLSECQSCKQELTQMQLVHRHMTAIPVAEPDAQKMRTDFYDMLYEYKRATVQAHSGWISGLREKIAQVWRPVYAMQLITGILLLLMGWAGGYWFNPQRVESQQLSQLAREVQQMRETMLLTMLEKPAATERLKAVNYTQNLSPVDEKVIQALLQTLNNDPNINVRLVTVETLRQLASYASVREGLIQSIPLQESPMVQIALADVMVNLQEKRSVSALQQLLKQENLNASVKDKLEQSVKVLM
jgi:uncharacterized protein YneF (UPF0154 family)